MQGYYDVRKWTILKRTLPEVKCLHQMSSRREMYTLSISNVIYHKFSHGAAFYTLNGKKVNVMLEFFLFVIKTNVMTPYLNVLLRGFRCLIETVQMRGHNICIHVNLTKIILNYHKMLPLI